VTPSALKVSRPIVDSRQGGDVQTQETIEAMSSAAIPTSPPATELSRNAPPIRCARVPDQAAARAAPIIARIARAFQKVLSVSKG
jgi:hypothetical protein